VHWLHAAKEAGWGLFLIVIIMGGIYGGVFTPTEAAIVAAIYSMLVAIFIYRDMGPLQDSPWVVESDSQQAQVGFRATVYGVSFFLVSSILTFFVVGTSENGFEPGNWTFIIVFSLLSCGAYLNWRILPEQSKSQALMLALPIWGRNLSLIVRNFIPGLFGGQARSTILEGTKTTVMLMFIIANALLFAHTLSAERIPQMITEWMLGIGFNWFTFLIAINILLLIGGQFMEPSGLLVIVAPVVFPIAMALGIDPIHLGIIMVVNMEIGMITPPIGLNLFVTSGITGMSLSRVVKAAIPFMLVLMVFLVMVTYLPAISTWFSGGILTLCRDSPYDPEI
jgi:C4-dicarboxylate transporter DctM subunit